MPEFVSFLESNAIGLCGLLVSVFGIFVSVVGISAATILGIRSISKQTAMMEEQLQQQIRLMKIDFKKSAYLEALDQINTVIDNLDNVFKTMPSRDMSEEEASEADKENAKSAAVLFDSLDETSRYIDKCEVVGGEAFASHLNALCNNITEKMRGFLYRIKSGDIVVTAEEKIESIEQLRSLCEKAKDTIKKEIMIER